MKLVIEIPDNEYHQICELRLHNRTFYDAAIRNGTPLPKGHWIEHEIEDTLRWLECSNCHCETYNVKHNYCPNCGADMRDKENEE